MSQLLDPDWDRASILPVGRNRKTGKLGMAVPQVAADLLSALMLPGDVYKGNVLMNDPATGHTSDEVIRRSADLAGSVTLGAGAIPAEKGALRMGAGRATKGGETGVNSYFYKGGQFLPTTEAPPGTWRVKIKGKAQNMPNGAELVAPGVFEPRPTPFSRSIMRVMGGGSLVDIDDAGVAKINPNVNWEYMGVTPDEKQPVRFKQIGESAEHFSVADLVDMYNKGVRWIDTDPLPGVEVIDKK